MPSKSHQQVATCCDAASMRAAELTAEVKRTARSAGAADVGVAQLHAGWSSPSSALGDDGRPVRLDSGLTHAVVMAVPMGEMATDGGTVQVRAAEVLFGYSKMLFLNRRVGDLLRSRGHVVLESVNDLTANVPLAISAGLGEQGRMGVLIHPRLGARVWLCKVMTNAPLVADHPIEFGTRAFCEDCGLCAKRCPNQAIPLSGGQVRTSSGQLRWTIMAERCIGDIWAPGTTGCSICVAACPYTLRIRSLIPERSGQADEAR